MMREEKRGARPGCLVGRRNDFRRDFRRIATILVIAGAAFLSSPACAQAGPIGNLPLQDRLKSCDAAVALAAAEESVTSPASLSEPLGLFTAAMTFYRHGRKDKAVFWYYAATLRTRYQLVTQRGDRGQLLQIMSMTVGAPINNHALQNTAALVRTLDQVLEWDRKTPNPHKAAVVTDEQRQQVAQVYKGMEDLKQKLVAERAEIEAKARAAMAEVAAYYPASAGCKPGEIDPAMVDTLVKAEKTAVEQFVRNHRDAVALGAIRSVNVGSYSMSRGAQMPVRYDVSVTLEKRTVFAIVDVDRKAAVAAFNLKCITPLSSGQREAHKDACAQ